MVSFRILRPRKDPLPTKAPGRAMDERRAYRWRAAAIPICNLVGAALTLHLHTASAAEGTEHVEQLEGVEVYGSPPELASQRQAITDAENRFYARYNELNLNDDFDVNCRVEARTGTRLTSRTCRPLYQEDAVQEGAKLAVEIRQKAQSYGGQALLGANTPPVPAAVAITARRGEFERNMRNVVRRHPELVMLLEERAAAAEALERATRRRKADSTDTHQPDTEPGK